jgi:hypothetical protein
MVDDLSTQIEMVPMCLRQERYSAYLYKYRL